jgi:hypothetical protein
VTSITFWEIITLHAAYYISVKLRKSP